MCICCRKLIEWFAMIAASIYSLLTLAYVLSTLFLGVILVPIMIRTEIIYDLSLSLLALLTTILLYVQALALLTATERLVEIMSKVTEYVRLP